MSARQGRQCSPFRTQTYIPSIHFMTWFQGPPTQAGTSTISWCTAAAHLANRSCWSKIPQWTSSNHPHWTLNRGTTQAVLPDCSMRKFLNLAYQDTHTHTYNMMHAKIFALQVLTCKDRLIWRRVLTVITKISVMMQLKGKLRGALSMATILLAGQHH